MKIRAIPATGQVLILGDDKATDYISDYTPDLPAKTEEVHFFGADYPRILDHNLGANARSWKVNRLHKNEATAFLFAEQHPVECRGSFTLEITSDTGAVVFLPAVRSVCKPLECAGVGTVFQYSFLCEGVSITPPKTT